MIYYPKEPTVPYVERPTFRRDVLTLIQSGLTKHINLGDAPAIYGKGKTTVLAKLFYELKAAGAPDAPQEIKALSDRIPIWISLDGFSVTYNNVLIHDLDSVAALRQNFEDFKKLLVLLGSQIDQGAFDGLADQLENITGEVFEKLFSFNIQAQGGKLDVGTLAQIHDNDIDVGNVNVDLKVENWEVILREALKSKITRFIQEFLKIYTSLGAQKKFVLIADDFGWIMDYPIGDWFLDLIRQMDNLVTLLSHTITGKTLHWDSHQMVNLPLPPFSLDEVRQYMLQRELTLTDDQIEKVYQFSKAGHPLLASLAGDLIARLDRRESQDADIVLDRLVGKTKGNQNFIFNSLPIDNDELTRQIDSIIIELRNDIQKYDPKLLFGLNVIALARKFDYNLLKFMFKQNLLDKKDESWDEDKAEQEAEQLAHEMILRMPEYSIVQELEDKDLKNSVYRVQYIVRSRMEVNLINSEPPEHIQRIHSQLIDYYQGIQTYSMKTETEYTAMFRLQHSDWQNDVIEWLYHLFCLEDRNRARLLLCKFFLEAFDWWGWYIAFDFCANLCNDLLVEWGQTQPAEDQKVVSLLLDFQNTYPTGYEKHGKGNWMKVEISLQNLLATLDLNLDPTEMNADQRMVRGHLDRYIAEGYRFSIKPNFQRAEAAYNSSLKYFEGHWNRAWIIDFMADLYLDWMKQLEEARDTSHAQEKAAAAEKYAGQSNQMAAEVEDYQDQDHELISQNYRILGSVYLRQNDLDKAFQIFALSIAHAYIFHFQKDNQDEYSHQFYADTGEQVLRALDSLVKQGRLEDACQASQFLRDFWEQQASFYMETIFSAMPDNFNLKAALASDQVDSLRQFIFPIIPEVGAEGDPIDTGVAISQTIADGIKPAG
jgi:hypothetical protein